MILVFIYCLFLFVLLTPFGLVTARLLKLKKLHPVLNPLLGLGFLSIVFSVIAPFYRLNIEVFLLTLLASIYLSIRYKPLLITNYKLIVSEFQNLDVFYRFLWILVVLLACVKSSGAPFVIDNESYYVQTINWINEYGFVKGVANLHIYFAQTSTWHVLQAGLNFSFLTDRINDLNAFLVIVCSFFYIVKFQLNRQNHWIGFLLAFNVLLFQFIDAPSPDLPLILIFPIILYYFTKKDNKDGLSISIFLFFLLVVIKLTILPLGLLFLFWIKQRKKVVKTIIIGIIFLIPWVVKNSIISGYPFYPFNWIGLNVDWLVPEKLRSFAEEITVKAGYFESNHQGGHVGFLEKLHSWINLSGINAIFNRGIIILFVVAFVTKSFQEKKRFRIIYWVLLVHFIFILFTSPQYRFFLIEFMFLSAFLIQDGVQYLKNKYLSRPILLISCLLPIVFLFPMNIPLTDNLHHQAISKYQISQLFVPHPNTKFPEMEYRTVTIGNLDFNSPKNNFMLFGSGAGDLPCVNEVYMNYILNKFEIYPQLRTDNVKDGFYSKPTQHDAL